VARAFARPRCDRQPADLSIALMWGSSAEISYIGSGSLNDGSRCIAEVPSVLQMSPKMRRLLEDNLDRARLSLNAQSSDLIFHDTGNGWVSASRHERPI
jgi:hypothetical protein